jgi:cation:H+ antiporter
LKTTQHAAPAFQVALVLTPSIMGPWPLNAWSETIFDSLLFVVGLGLFLLGSKWLVDGASQLSIALGVSPFVVGLTVVAFGSSAPEAALAVTAVSAESGAIALGNVVGSNIFNSLFVIGLASGLNPIIVPPEMLLLEMPLMILLGVLLLVVIWLWKSICRATGVMLIVIYLLYLILLAQRSGVF